MKNENYNLVKLLLGQLDDAWRIEKHYMDDTNCPICSALLKKMLEDGKKHVEALREEVARHAAASKLE